MAERFHYKLHGQTLVLKTQAKAYFKFANHSLYKTIREPLLRSLSLNSDSHISCLLKLTEQKDRFEDPKFCRDILFGYAVLMENSVQVTVKDALSHLHVLLFFGLFATATERVSEDLIFRLFHLYNLKDV